jgi:SAM-dependent methyltransferase
MYTGITARQQTAWAAGDFAEVATSIIIVGELLCEAVDVEAGDRVLDVACGSGNTALAAARRYAEVTGVDFVPSLLVRARERAAAEHLKVDFQEGDAQNLPFADASFDVVLSTFGCMFAPDQDKTAAELLRVCKPGGKIGMANWRPESFAATMFRTTAKYNLPPPGVSPPIKWGTEEAIRAWFGPHASEIKVQQRHVMFRYPSPDYFIELFRKCFGPVKLTFDALDPEKQDALRADIRAEIAKVNRSKRSMHFPGEYLEVVIRKK